MTDDGDSNLNNVTLVNKLLCYCLQARSCIQWSCMLINIMYNIVWQCIVYDIV